MPNASGFVPRTQTAKAISDVAPFATTEAIRGATAGVAKSAAVQATATNEQTALLEILRSIDAKLGSLILMTANMTGVYIDPDTQYGAH